MKKIIAVLLCLVLVSTPSYAVSKTVLKILCYTAIVGGILIFANNTRNVPCETRTYTAKSWDSVSKSYIDKQFTTSDTKTLSFNGAFLGLITSFAGVFGLFALKTKEVDYERDYQKLEAVKTQREQDSLEASGRYLQVLPG